jgi:hypothetical protein
MRQHGRQRRNGPERGFSTLENAGNGPEPFLYAVAGPGRREVLSAGLARWLVGSCFLGKLFGRRLRGLRRWAQK